jgi:branched-chain amino acid transport system permease protein
MVRIEHKRARIIIRFKNSKYEWTIEPRYWRNPLIAVVALVLAPLLIRDYPNLLTLLTTAYIYMLICIPQSWQTVGTGRLNFGPQFFVGLGGYTAGLLSIHYGFGPLQTLPVVILISLAFAALFSPLTIIAGGLYFSLITLLLPLVFLEFTYVYSGIFRGETGISGIAPLINLGTIRLNYVVLCYISLFMTLVYMLLIDKILRSRWGVLYGAINDNENAANMMGVNINKLKVTCYIASSVLVGIAGWFIAHYFGTFAGVTYLPFTMLIKVLLISMLGGRAQIYGVAAGAFFVVFLEDALRSLGAIHYWIFPIILLVFLFALPEGLWGIYRKHKYREYYPTMRVRKR